MQNSKTNKHEHAQQASQAQATIALALLNCQHVNNSKACTVTSHGQLVLIPATANMTPKFSQSPGLVSTLTVEESLSFERKWLRASISPTWVNTSASRKNSTTSRFPQERGSYPEIRSSKTGFLSERLSSRFHGSRKTKFSKT